MRKGFKILLRIIGGMFLGLLVLVIAAPLLFKEEIIELFRRSINRQIEGAFYFEKADVGLLSTFPDFCLELSKPVLTGTRNTADDTLFSATELDLVFDLRSVLRKNTPLKVIGIRLDEPKVSVSIDREGHANYQLLSQSEDDKKATSGDSLVVDIQNYRIDHGYLKYADQTTSLVLTFEDVDHTGTLLYHGNTLDLNSSTTNALISVNYAGVPYMDQINMSGQNAITIDLDREVYTLGENHLLLNTLGVDLTGSIHSGNDATEFDLQFKGARNTFKNFVSLLPNVYTTDFDAVKADGQLALHGSLKGALSASTTPVYDIQLNIDGGTFQYPKTPFGFNDIAVNATLRNAPSGWLPEIIDLKTLHFLLNSNPFDISALITNPSGNGTYKGSMKGTLNLADFADAYPLPGSTHLQGQTTADVDFDIKSGRPAADQKVSGRLSLKQIVAQIQGEQFAVDDGQIAFTPGSIHATTTSGSWNDAPFALDIAAKDYVQWLTAGSSMAISGMANLRKLDYNRYLTQTDSPPETAPGNQDLSNIQVSADVEIDTLLYDAYTVTDGHASLKGTLKEMQVSNLRGAINGTKFRANGTLDDIDRYLNNTAPLSGTLDCDLDDIYVDRWIDSTGVAEATEPSPVTSYIALPEDLHLNITFRAANAYYDRISIRNPRGSLTLHDRILEMRDLTGDAMGGSIVFSGLYNTQNVEHPGFNMKYDLSSLKFSDAFSEVKTFAALAPIAQWLNGIFNSTLVMEGQLGNNYMPDLGTLSASGFLETITGKFNKAEVFSKLSQFLNLKEPITMDVSKTRNWFEVKNGYVILQETSKTVDGMEVSYSGRHQIHGDMDYRINLNIPADKLTANPVGALAKTGLDQLQKKAASYGIKLNSIDRFIVEVAIRGKLNDPRFEIISFDASGKSLKEAAAGQLADIKKEVRDTVSVVAQEKINTAKDTLTTMAGRAVDSASHLTEKVIKEAGKDILTQASGKVDSLLPDSLKSGALNKAGEKAKEVLGDKAGEGADKIKDALNKWDPFKKKKKD